MAEQRTKRRNRRMKEVVLIGMILIAVFIKKGIIDYYKNVIR